MTEFDKLVKMVQDGNKSQLETMIAKNHDYAGDNPDDPMANFNLVETMLGISAEMGLMVRILDKENRIANFLKTGIMKVADEKIDDTIDDAINYHRLLKFRIQQRRDSQEETTRMEIAEPFHNEFLQEYTDKILQSGESTPEEEIPEKEEALNEITLTPKQWQAWVNLNQGSPMSSMAVKQTPFTNYHQKELDVLVDLGLALKTSRGGYYRNESLRNIKVYRG